MVLPPLQEFFQGGLNQFKTQLADQLQNGIYLTERKQVEVEQTDLAPVGSDQTDDTGRRGEKLVKARQLVWKTVPLYDKAGALRRAENPLSQYGIDVTQVLIGDPRPEENLDRLLMDKKVRRRRTRGRRPPIARGHWPLAPGRRRPIIALSSPRRPLHSHPRPVRELSGS